MCCIAILFYFVFIQYFHSSYHGCCEIRALGEANDKDSIKPANTHSDENDLAGPQDISDVCDGSETMCLQCL